MTSIPGPLAAGFDDAWYVYSPSGGSTSLALAIGGPSGQVARMGTSILAAELLGHDGLSDMFGGAPEARLSGASSGWIGTYPGSVEGGGDPGACMPRTHGFWHRQCLSLDAPEGLDPSRRSRRPGEHAIPAGELRELLRRVDKRACSVGTSTCEALRPVPAGNACTRARRAVVALLLNEAAGYLGRDAALLPPGHPPMRGGEAGDIVLGMLEGGECAEAEHLALVINSGAACRRGGRR